MCVVVLCVLCGVSDPTWVEQQSRAFVGWVNSILIEVDESIRDLSADLADGLRLVHVVEILEQRAKSDAGQVAFASPFTNYHKVEQQQHTNTPTMERRTKASRREPHTVLASYAHALPFSESKVEVSSY